MNIPLDLLDKPLPGPLSATNRPSAGNVGPDHLAAAAGRTDERLGSHPAHPGDFERRVVGERRVALPRAVPARITGPHQGDVEDHGKEATGEVLCADRRWSTPAGYRTEHVGAIRRRLDGHSQLKGESQCLNPC